VALCLAVLSACSVGTGEGRAEGVINVPECDLVDEPYSLQPSFWGGELVVDDQLEIRMQRSGALESASDGIRFLVRDPARVKRELLGAPIDLATLDPYQPAVRVSLYLNATCPVELDGIPVNYESVSGTVIFDAIYAPEVDDKDFRISMTFENVRLEADMRSEDHYAVMDGDIDFLYNRGRPAQRYP
jgi:hypothetical protein